MTQALVPTTTGSPSCLLDYKHCCQKTNGRTVSLYRDNAAAAKRGGGRNHPRGENGNRLTWEHLLCSCSTLSISWDWLRKKNSLALVDRRVYGRQEGYSEAPWIWQIMGCFAVLFGYTVNQHRLLLLWCLLIVRRGEGACLQRSSSP